MTKRMLVWLHLAILKCIVSSDNLATIVAMSIMWQLTEIICVIDPACIITNHLVTSI